jgi:hypothetical protein
MSVASRNGIRVNLEIIEDEEEKEEEATDPVESEASQEPSELV